MRNSAGNVMKGLARGMHRLTHAAYLLIHTLASEADFK